MKSNVGIKDMLNWVDKMKNLRGKELRKEVLSIGKSEIKYCKYNAKKEYRWNKKIMKKMDYFRKHPYIPIQISCREYFNEGHKGGCADVCIKLPYFSIKKGFHMKWKWVFQVDGKQIFHYVECADLHVYFSDISSISSVTGNDWPYKSWGGIVFEDEEIEIYDGDTLLKYAKKWFELFYPEYVDRLIYSEMNGE